MVFAAIVLAAFVGDEAAANQALDAFKNAYKAKEASARAAAVDELAKTTHPKVCAKLGSLLNVDLPDVRIAAAKGMVNQGEDRKHAVPLLLSGAQANAKDPAVLAAIVTALGHLKEDAGAVEVNKHLMAENVDLAKAAIEATGEIRSTTSMDPLIKLLKEIEDILKPRTVGDAADLGTGRISRINRQGANAQEERARARALQPLVLKSLGQIAGGQNENATEWESWWSKNKAKFKPSK